MPISRNSPALLCGHLLVLCRALLVVALSAVSPARGDWINLTGAETAPNIAEITVFDDRVEVALEVYVGDLKVFKDLIPDDWLKDLKVDRPPLADRLKRFSERGLHFVTDKGETLPSYASPSRACARIASRPSPGWSTPTPASRRRRPRPISVCSMRSWSTHFE